MQATLGVACTSGLQTTRAPVFVLRGRVYNTFLELFHGSFCAPHVLTVCVTSHSKCVCCVWGDVWANWPMAAPVPALPPCKLRWCPLRANVTRSAVMSHRRVHTSVPSGLLPLCKRTCRRPRHLAQPSTMCGVRKRASFEISATLSARVEIVCCAWCGLCLRRTGTNTFCLDCQASGLAVCTYASTRTPWTTEALASGYDVEAWTDSSWIRASPSSLPSHTRKTVASGQGVSPTRC